MIKCFYFTVFKKRKLMSNLQISLALGFIITLLPIIPNGNFFNKSSKISFRTSGAINKIIYLKSKSIPIVAGAPHKNIKEAITVIIKKFLI